MQNDAVFEFISVTGNQYKTYTGIIIANFNSDLLCNKSIEYVIVMQ